MRQKVNGGLGARFGGAAGPRLIVTDLLHVRTIDDVLRPDERSVIVGLTQGVDDVLIVVIEAPAPVRKPRHAGFVRIRPGQQ